MKFKVVLSYAELTGGFVKVSMGAKRIFTGTEHDVSNVKECETIVQDAIKEVQESEYKGCCHIACYHDGRKVRGYDDWKRGKLHVEFA